MTRKKYTYQSGEISGVQVTIAGLAVLVLGLGSFGIWSFVNYQDAQSNLDDKISVAVANGQKEQADADETKFAEREKETNKTFKGPDDYCGLSFNYPKTWSVYEANDIKNGGDYVAYLNPDKIPPVSPDTQYATRVLIQQKDYDDIVDSYASLVKKGTLKKGTTASQGNEGTRLDGTFSKNIRGSVVIYKCRDRTISIFSDADSFNSDYEKLIRTITYNK